MKLKEELNINIGSRVSTARNKAHLSQEALAELLDVSPLFISYIECGKKGMSLTTLMKLCKALEVSSDYILFGDNASNNSRKNIERTLDNIDEAFMPVVEMTVKNTARSIQAMTDIIKKQ